jgi:hypothetical protein
VEGNAEAESHAKAYRTGMIAGVTTALAGVVSAVGGGVLYFSNANGPEAERNGTAEAVGGTLLVGGIAAYITGMVFLLNAQPHLWDAINAYNDGVDHGPLRAPPAVMPPAQGAYAPLPGAYAPLAAGAYAPSVPLGASPHKSKLPPSSEGSSLPVAPAPSSVPSPPPPATTSPVPVPEVAPNAAEPPAPDLDLDKVEAEAK